MRSRARPSPLAHGAARTLALAAALAAAGCLGESSGPRPLRMAAFAVAPVFSRQAATGAASVAFDRVRVTLSRSEGLALDTTVVFPPEADSLVLTLNVPINGPSETFLLNLAMINAAGDTVYRAGPVPVTVSSTFGGGAPLDVPVHYSGVGANADSVRIEPQTAALSFRDSLVLSAVAYDSAGEPIPGTPVAWRSLDPTIAAVDTSGKVVAGSTAGVARIEASLPTGQADTALVTVRQLPPAKLVFSTEPPSSTLPQSPFAVAVAAQDSAGNPAPTFTGTVTLAIGTNPGGGTLSGTLTQTAVAGVATFSGLSIDNLGTGYTLTATASGLTTATSVAFDVAPPPGVNAWINAAGGNWSNAANWSKGTVPTASDTVTISQSGTYTVNLDVNGTYGFLTVGAASGTQTLAIAANTLTAGNGVFTAHGALALSGTGTLNVTGALVVSGPTTWSGGTINVASGVLSLGGGTGASFGGTAAVATGAALNLAGGTFALTSATTISGSGSVIVTGGSLAPNGHTLAIAGDFATSGTGVLQMTQAGDSLAVSGNATFAGGSTTGLLTGGKLSVGGSFAQAGAADAFAPSGTQTTLLVGSGTQTITFTNPTTSFFRRLVINALSRGVVLQTNALVTDSLTMLAGAGGATLTGAGNSQRLTVGGALWLQSSTVSPQLAPPVLVLSVAPTIQPTVPNALSPDTTVLQGSITTVPTGLGIGWKSVRVATGGTVTSPGNVIYHGALIVSSGTYAMGSGLDSVAAFFRTEGTGALSMTASVASPTLAVTDSAVFAGGASTTLTGGVLRLWGNFVERGTSGQFAPSVAHRVTLVRAAAGTQTIQLADSVNSFFYDLDLRRPTVDTVRLRSNVLVKDSAIVSLATVLASTTNEALKTPAGGVLRVHSQAVLRPFRAEAGSWVLDSTFLGGNAVRISPDTAVILNAAAFNVGGSLGFISSSPAPVLGWKSVRLMSGTLTSSGTNYAGALVVGGTGVYQPGSGTDSVYGFLRTEGSGILQMLTTLETGNLVVEDSAVFGGGDESGNLTNGFIYVGGDFIQRGGPTTFAGDTNHYVVFDGASTQHVTFANPGATASRFGNLVIARFGTAGDTLPAGITLSSNIVALISIQDASTASAPDSIVSNGDTVATFNLFAGSNFVLHNTALVTGSSIIAGSGITFRNMDPTITQWTIGVPAGLSAGTQLPLSGVNFQTQPTTGKYFAALVTGASGSATLVFTSPVAPTFAALNGSSYYSTIGVNGTVTTTWGGQQLTDQQ